VDVARIGSLEDTSGAHWIGPKPSKVPLVAVLLVGTMGMMICGVQPVLLGSLVLERRLSSAALGWATTAEFLTLALGIWLAGTFWKPTHLRSRIALAAVLAMIADGLVIGEQGTTVLLNRALAGLPEGILVWLTGCMIARSPLPARMAGIFLTLQNVSQFAFAAILPPTLMHRYGANGGFVALAFTAALALLATPLVPSSFVELAAPRGHSGRAVYSGSVIVCLLSIFLISAFSIGLFAYIAPLGAQAHLSEEMIGYAVSAVLGASTLGSALAAAAAKKIPHYAVFAVCMLVNAIVVAVFATMPGAPVFLSTAALFGFFWLFFLPFQVPMAIEADPTRRIAVVLPGAQLLGAGAGPLLSSFFVTDTDARGALIVCWVCLLIAFAMSTVQHFRRRRQDRLHPRDLTS
jgi:predicted MFS family arabinose efflux permease